LSGADSINMPLSPRHLTHKVSFAAGELDNHGLEP
jgi:hypothetical protein